MDNGDVAMRSGYRKVNEEGIHHGEGPAIEGPLGVDSSRGMKPEGSGPGLGGYNDRGAMYSEGDGCSGMSSNHQAGREELDMLDGLMTQQHQHKTQQQQTKNFVSNELDGFEIDLENEVDLVEWNIGLDIDLDVEMADPGVLDHGAGRESTRVEYVESSSRIGECHEG